MNSLYFFGDYISLKPDEVIELYPGYRLRRPTLGEVEYILKVSSGAGIVAEWISHFEHRFERVFYIEKGFYKIKYSESVNWTYSVIEYDAQDFNFLLELALRLSTLELRPLVDIIGGKSIRHRPLHVYVFFGESDIKESLNPKNVTLDDINEINDIMTTLISFDNMDGEFPYISKSIKDFYDLITIPKTSPFRILQYSQLLNHCLQITQKIQETA